jgi:hypothetical protein
VATSPYQALGDEDWGRLLAIGAIHLSCAEGLRRYATLRESSAILGNLHSGMMLNAGVAAQQPTDQVVVEHMCAATLANAQTLRAHPDLTVDDNIVLRQICTALAQAIPHGDPYADLYGRCEAAAAQMYGTAWPVPDPFELEAYSAHPRGLTDGYTVGGSTDASGRAVRLQLCPLNFGPEAFAVIARVLLHELICHVGAGDNDPPDPLSPFAEGLMDWASLHFLHNWAYDLCGGYANAAIMHALQSAGSFKTDARTKAARDNGEDAALLLVQQSGTETGVAQFAIDVNAASRSRARKDELVLQILETTLDARKPPLRDALERRTSVEDLLDAL